MKPAEIHIIDVTLREGEQFAKVFFTSNRPLEAIAFWRRPNASPVCDSK